MSVEFPRHGDELFQYEFSDWSNNAILNYTVGKFSLYADGYRLSAEALVTKSITEIGVKDALVYPIVFLYRQYLELRLKEIIMGLVYCNQGMTEFPRTHKVEALWGKFKYEYIQLGESVDDAIFVNATLLIKEFSRIDPNSVAFRYPVDMQGNDTVSLTTVNIRNFGEVMERLANFLDSISDQIAHYIDLVNDNMRDEY